jgi:ankyrin repeat protein
MVAYLLKLGANPNIGSNVGSFSTAKRLQMSPKSGSILRGAVRIGNLESIDLLVSYGAEIANAGLMHPATICGKASVMARVLELGANIDEKDDMLKTGYPTYGTPLLRAIKTRDSNAVRFLLERGANVFQPGYDGWTPLQVVRMECCCGGLSLPVCRIHGMEILPEMAQLIETAVKKEGEQHQAE